MITLNAAFQPKIGSFNKSEENYSQNRRGDRTFAPPSTVISKRRVPIGEVDAVLKNSVIRRKTGYKENDIAIKDKLSDDS